MSKSEGLGATFESVFLTFEPFIPRSARTAIFAENFSPRRILDSDAKIKEKR